MARFEGALAQACAGTGLVPREAALTIAEVAATATFDATALAPAARRAGALTIPFVKQLTEKVAAVGRRRQRATSTHWFDQPDVIDTGAVLCLRPCGGCALRHLFPAWAMPRPRWRSANARTPIRSRATLLQPAVSGPVPFG